MCRLRLQSGFGRILFRKAQLLKLRFGKLDVCIRADCQELREYNEREIRERTAVDHYIAKLESEVFFVPRDVVP
jgi:hypothetical protein